VGQFYGEISVIFFLSFRLKTAFSLPFGVFVSTSRERECLFSRGADSFLKKFLLLFFLVVVAKYFFFAERKQAEQLFKFCFFVCLFAFFLSFVSHERDLRFKEKSHPTHRHYIKHDS
jgi:hypothetical protein